MIADDCHYLQVVIVSFKLLLESSNKLYNFMIIPEIDVLQMKELIEKAIKEFKKQVNGCDIAF